jgi:endonuclease G
MSATIADYSDRSGYDPSFLRPGKLDGRVFLPTLGKALAANATRLIGDKKSYLLHYFGFTLVMHGTRRFAIYSAANVDFSGRFDMPRPKDKWLTDPRIPAESQVDGAFYENNQFDRGHLTRREDMEYGSTRPEALSTAADTCHWANCTPQHAIFNEGKQLWQGIERHILEDAVAPEQFRAQVITGPVFDPKDPELDGFPGTPYPLRYWKVACAINASGKLFATGYVLDQRGVISEFGLRGAPEVPFTPYKTFQTTIAEIERLTGLAFTGGKGSKRVSLAEFDPLAKRPRVRGAGAEANYLELGSVENIVMH